MTGLRISTDLDAWQRWRARQTPLRTLKRRARPTGARTRYAWVNSDEPPRALVGVAATTTSGRAALVAPLEHLGHTPTMVLSEEAIDHHLPDWRRTTADLPDSVKVVLADGHYLALGHDLWLLARARRIPYFVAQHGLITPLAPPLAPGSTLLAWSAADGQFWRSGRTDVAVRVVGSQLLWNAAGGGGGRTMNRTSSDREDRPLVYLGQGHAAEISRTLNIEAAVRFCREHEAIYRPHPSEQDRVSLGPQGLPKGRHQSGHRRRAAGRSAQPRRERLLHRHPRGGRTWARCMGDFPPPPSVARRVLGQHGMQRFGQRPTPPPAQPSADPARLIAEELVAHAD